MLERYNTRALRAELERRTKGGRGAARGKRAPREADEKRSPTRTERPRGGARG